jgi:hypothetical protein
MYNSLFPCSQFTLLFLGLGVPTVCAFSQVLVSWLELPFLYGIVYSSHYTPTLLWLPVGCLRSLPLLPPLSGLDDRGLARCLCGLDVWRGLAIGRGERAVRGGRRRKEYDVER